MKFLLIYVPNLRFSYKGDWSKRKLNEICQFFKGNGLSKSDLSNEGFPCILYGELYTTYKNEVISDIISKTNTTLSNPFLSRNNDLIIPGSGEDPIDIAVARAIYQNDIILGGDLNILRPKSNVSAAFLSYQLNGVRRYDIAKKAQGKSIVHLHNSDLKEVLVSIPSYEEQLHIVKLLTKIDEMIEIQSKIIDRLYSQIKYIKGQILNITTITETKPLGQLCNISTGKRDANEMKSNGSYKFFTCSKDDYCIDTYSFDGEALIISGNGELGLIKYYNGKFDAYQRTYVLQNFKCHPKYLMYVLQNKLPKKIEKEKNVGAMPYIVLKTLTSINIDILNMHDQIKIVNILNKFEEKLENDRILLELFEKEKSFLLKNLFV